MTGPDKGEALTIGSLFSGIGGLELGLQRGGLGAVKWQAESDEFAREILARHWPTARRYEDVRAITHEAERVDVVCGGFPCQDVSVAGAGAGLDGPRSGLWTELVRVARVVGCRYLVMENVAALLVRGLGDVLGALAESGFDAAWDCIPASAVGAPHRRDRVFLLAWRVPDPVRHPVRQLAERGPRPALAPVPRHAEPRDLGASTSVGPPHPRLDEAARSATRAGLRPTPEVEALRRAADVLADTDRWRREIERVANRKPADEGAPRRLADGRRVPQWPPASHDPEAWARVPAEAQPALRRVAHGPPRRLDRARRARRLKALGNAVVPAAAEVVGRLIVQAERERMRDIRGLR